MSHVLRPVRPDCLRVCWRSPPNVTDGSAVARSPPVSVSIIVAADQGAKTAANLADDVRSAVQRALADPRNPTLLGAAQRQCLGGDPRQVPVPAAADP